MIKIRPKNRRWIIHYHKCGIGHENFKDDWPIDSNGVSAVQAFASKESIGNKIPTRCSTTINRLTAGKKIHGMTVDMWAKDWANGLLSKAEVIEYCNGVDGLYEEVYLIKWRKYA